MYISIDNTAQVVLQLGRGTLRGIKARCIRSWSTYWPSATHLLLHSPSLIYSHWWCSWVGEVEGTRSSENIWVRGIQLDFSLCWRFFIFSGSPTSSQYSVAMGLQLNMYAQTLDSPIETEADGLPLILWSWIWTLKPLCFTFPSQNSIFWDKRCKHGLAGSDAWSANSCPQSGPCNMLLQL